MYSSAGGERGKAISRFSSAKKDVLRLTHSIKISSLPFLLSVSSRAYFTSAPDWRHIYLGIRTAKTSFCPSVHSLKCQRSLNSIPQAVCACFADAKIQPSLIQTKFQTSTPSFFDVRSKKTLVCIARGDDAGILPIHCIDLSTFRLGKQYRCMTSRLFSRPIIVVQNRRFLSWISKALDRTIRSHPAIWHPSRKTLQGRESLWNLMSLYAVISAI